MINRKNIEISRPEYQKKLFTSVVGKNGRTYFYNADPRSVWVEGNGEGAGGRTLAYEMMDGSVEELQGPWNTNPQELLEQTGVDLTANFFSYGFVIRKEDLEAFKKGKDVEVINETEGWITGGFNLGIDLMKFVTPAGQGLVIGQFNHYGSLVTEVV